MELNIELQERNIFQRAFKSSHDIPPLKQLDEIEGSLAWKSTQKDLEYHYQNVMQFEIEKPARNQENVLKKIKKNDDSREFIKDPKKMPYNKLVFLSLLFENRNPGERESGWGTGCLVGPHFILTCGHNVYSPINKGFVKSIEAFFCFSSEGFLTKASVVKYFYRENFSKFQTCQDDIALLVIDHGIGNTLGWTGMASFSNTNDLISKEVGLYGYPSDKDDKTPQLWGMKYNVESIEEKIFKYYHDTSGGQSGSPLLIEQNGAYYAIGVHTSGFENYNQGVRLSEQLLRAFHKVMRDNWVLEEMSYEFHLVKTPIKPPPQIGGLLNNLLLNVHWNFRMIFENYLTKQIKVRVEQSNSDEAAFYTILSSESDVWKRAPGTYKIFIDGEGIPAYSLMVTMPSHDITIKIKGYKHDEAEGANKFHTILLPNELGVLQVRLKNVKFNQYLVSSRDKYNDERIYVYLESRDLTAKDDDRWEMHFDDDYGTALKNIERNEYLYAADNIYNGKLDNLDHTKRNVFTWFPGVKINNGFWKMKETESLGVYKIENTKNKGYLFADDKEESSRRMVFVSRADSPVGEEAYWRVEDF